MSYLTTDHKIDVLLTMQRWVYENQRIDIEELDSLTVRLGLDPEEYDDIFWTKLYKLKVGKRLIAIDGGNEPTIVSREKRRVWVPLNPIHERAINAYLGRRLSQTLGAQASLETDIREAESAGVIVTIR